MKFYVIYSFDIKRDQSVVPFKPPLIKQWQMTEDDDCYEFDYLADESDDDTYRNGKHRKYVAMLNKEQFIRFIDDTGLHMVDIETMGSLTELGHLPAFSFDIDYDTYAIWQNAYVTPFPEHAIKGKEFSEETMNDTNWNRIKQAMLNMFE